MRAGVPFVLPLNVANWLGGRGGHIGFSPVMPPSGKLAWEAFLKRKTRFEAENLDYYSSFTVGHRHISNVNMILYNRDDPATVTGAKKAFRAMMADAGLRPGGFDAQRMGTVIGCGAGRRGPSGLKTAASRPTAPTSLRHTRSLRTRKS